MICSAGDSQVIISLVFGDKLNSDKLEFGLDGGANWSTLHEDGKRQSSKKESDGVNKVEVEISVAEIRSVLI